MRIDTSSSVLWGSAFLLAGLVIVTAGRLPANPAYAADTSSSAGDYTLLSVDSGRGEDAAPDELLYVIDSRSESLLIYEIPDARQAQIVLRDGGSLAGLFGQARH
jgi:hypothetical protein